MTRQPDPSTPPMGIPPAPGTAPIAPQYQPPQYEQAPQAWPQQAPGYDQAWSGPRPIPHHRASRSLLVVTVVALVVATIGIVLGSIAAHGDAYAAGYLTAGPVMSLIAAAVILGLTVGGRRRADQGRGGMLRAAGITAIVVGGLTLLSSLSMLALGGIVSAVLLLVGGIQVVRVPRR